MTIFRSRAPVAIVSHRTAASSPAWAQSTAAGGESAPSAPAAASTDPSASATPVADALAPAWRIQIEPSIWYVSPSGRVKLPVSSGTGPGGFTTAGDDVKLERLNLDSPRFEPTGEVHLTGARWRFTFSGATYSVEQDTTADSTFRLGSITAAPGDRLDVDFDFTTVEATAGYRFLGRDFADPARTEQPDQGVAAVGRVHALFGARFYDVGFDVRTASGPFEQASADEFFAEPIAGLRAELDLAEAFSLDLQVTAGGLPAGDHTSYSLDIMAGFQWRPHPNVGLQIGYRQLAYWLSDGEDAEEFEYNGRLAGLFAGLVVRF